MAIVLLLTTSCHGDLKVSPGFWRLQAGFTWVNSVGAVPWKEKLENFFKMVSYKTFLCRKKKKLPRSGGKNKYPLFEGGAATEEECDLKKKNAIYCLVGAFNVTLKTSRKSWTLVPPSRRPKFSGTGLELAALRSDPSFLCSGRHLAAVFFYIFIAFSRFFNGEHTAIIPGRTNIPRISCIIFPEIV